MTNDSVSNHDKSVTKKQTSAVDIPTGYLLDEFKRGKLLQLANSFDGLSMMIFNGDINSARTQPDVMRENLSDMISMLTDQLRDQIEDMLFLIPHKDATTMRIKMD